MKNKELENSKLYVIYNNMYNRCYNEKVQANKPWYKGVTMCDEWLADRQAFYDWVNDGNFYVIDGEPTVELDHNILVKGNTVYSPDTCVFAPRSINAMIGGSSKKQTDESLPKGVQRMKNGKYKPQIKGFPDVFDTIEDAWEVYAIHRKAKIITTADAYVGKIPYKLYVALINWQLDIND